MGENVSRKMLEYPPGYQAVALCLTLKVKVITKVTSERKIVIYS